MLTQLQLLLLRAIDTHGPLSFNEATAAVHTAMPSVTWDDVHQAARTLARSGHVFMLHDERVRLTAGGRSVAQQEQLELFADAKRNA